MNNKKENDNTKKYLRKVHGRIKICMLCLNDSQMYIITKGEIGPKKHPISFYRTTIMREMLDFNTTDAYEQIKSHLLSPNGRIRCKKKD